MKKLLVFSLVLLFAIATVPIQARNLINHKKGQMIEARKVPDVKGKARISPQGNKVSDLSKDQFSQDFGDISGVVWKRVDNLDQATFVKSGHSITAYYDTNSNLIGTTSPVKFANLPAKGRKQINEKYKGYKIGPVIFFKDNELINSPMTLYGTQFEDADNYFVELTKGNDHIVMRMEPDGNIFFFKKIQ